MEGAGGDPSNKDGGDEEETKAQSPIQTRTSRRFSGIAGVRRPSALMSTGPIVQSLRRATSWVLGRRDSNVPTDVPSKRISDGSITPIVPENNRPLLEPKTLMSVRCGGASMRGYRHKLNEDTLCIEANLVEGAQEAGHESVGFAAVFDGHAGGGCSAYLQTAMIMHVKRKLAEEVAVTGPTLDGIEWRRLVKNVLIDAFTDIDDEFLRVAQMRGDPSGSCAVAAVVKGSSVVVAHVGDCAVILIIREPEVRAIRMTRDHNSRNSAEVQRVTSCGGTIFNDRLGGKLQPFRAFGDVEFKTSTGGLTVQPDTLEHVMVPNNCLLLCSDGVTTYMTDQEIADFICTTLAQEDDDPARVASALVTHVSKSKFGLDDASAVLMIFDEVH